MIPAKLKSSLVSAYARYTSAYRLLSNSHLFVTLYFARIAPKKIPSVSAKHHTIILDDKLTIIKRHKKDEKGISIARSFGMSRTTILTIVTIRIRFWRISNLMPQG